MPQLNTTKMASSRTNLIKRQPLRVNLAQLVFDLFELFLDIVHRHKEMHRVRIGGILEFVIISSLAQEGNVNCRSLFVEGEAHKREPIRH